MKKGIWGVLLLGAMLALSACNANEDNMNKVNSQTEMNENITNDGMNSEKSMKDENMSNDDTMMEDKM